MKPAPVRVFASVNVYGVLLVCPWGCPVRLMP